MSNYSIPPNEVFKFRGNPDKPSDVKVQEPNTYFVTENINYCEKGCKEYPNNGIFVDYQGVPFPSKGHVFPEAIYAVCQVKKILMNGLKAIASKDMIFPILGLLISNKKKAIDRFLDSFIDIVDLNILKPYYLKDGYYSKATIEVRNFIREFLRELGIDYDKADLFGEMVSLTFQYDNAYYYRLVDIMSESSKERLSQGFPQEVKRLLSIILERDNCLAQIPKYNALANVLKYIYWIPSVKRAIIRGLNAVTFDNWQMDEADKYHMNLYDGYKVRGLDFKTRLQEYVDFHGIDNLPPRVRLVTNEQGEMEMIPVPKEKVIEELNR